MFSRIAVVCFTCFCLFAGVGSASAVEIRDLWLITRIPVVNRTLKTKVGWEVHFSHSETQEITDGANLAAMIALTKEPKVAAAVLLSAKFVRSQDKGNGVIVDVLFSGTICRVRSR